MRGFLVSFRSLPLLPVSWLLAACAAPPPDFTWFSSASAWHGPDAASAAAGEAAPSFDAVDPEARVAVGDEVVYAIDFRSPAERRKWRMRARVTGVDEAGGIVEFAVSVFDEAGKPVRTSRARVAADLLADGVYGFFAGPGPQAREGDPAQSFRRPIRVLWKMLGIVRRNEALAPFLWKVVRKPSVGSVVLHLGVRLRIVLDRGEPWSWGARDTRLAAYRLPLELALNETVALRCSIVCTETFSPFRPCAGLLAIVAERPDGSGTRLRLRLVGARRAVRVAGEAAGPGR